ncbi:MAG: hypothetical protein WD825_14305 [Gemmatimonadaceae bacterium]
MRILITKRTDGGAVLKCIRADGTETWQKQEGKSAAFFPLHDLTHYAVETELGVSGAFYGLIADGWPLEDTTGKGARGALPPEALFVENVVGTLDSERAGGARWTAEEFNKSIARHAANGGRPVPRRLSDDELARIRKRRAELFERWRELSAGQTLELSFLPGARDGSG